MMSSKSNSQSSNLAGRLLLFAFVALVSVAGCGKPVVPVATPISPLDEFSDERGVWQRSDSEPSAADNQQIGKFFTKRPNLVGSPEWTGQPEKYVSKDSKSLARFYWFSGNEENPSWNALEIDGSRIRELSGIGIPGAEEMN
jgi:hypothetical protein